MSSKIRLKKSLGQHFLRNESLAKKIVAALGIQNHDSVLEIGPGNGALTKLLLQETKEKEARFIAVEQDRRLIPDLKNLGCEVVNQDILQFSFRPFFEEGESRIKVIGNIPYQITSPLTFYLIESRAFIQKAVLTIQKEVAERLVATPGRKAYGRISVILQYYAQAEYLFDIGPEHFFPPPQVDSAVVSLTFLDQEKGREKIDSRLFEQIVKIAFSSRRKKLSNNLKGWFRQREIEEVVLKNFFGENSLSENARAEELSVEQFIQLTQKIQTEIGDH